MPFPASPISFDPRDFATYGSLQRVAAFEQGADAASRQAAIDYVVTAYGFSKDSTTKTLVYAASLDQPGRNIGGNIRIGPSAFEQDLAWLAGIVFHELVHSPQHAYYVSKGVTQIDPKASETERLMIALDEYEAYSWQLTRRVELGLSQAQQAEIRKYARFMLIDLNDSKASGLAQNHRFEAARDCLIQQYKAPAGGTNAVTSRRGSCGCYA